MRMVLHYTSSMEINYCRRCGDRASTSQPGIYVCPRNHTTFLSSSPGVNVILVNKNNDILLTIRALNPGKGRLDIPGGFLKYNESLEQALARELREELQLEPADYSTPAYILSGAEKYLFEDEADPVLSTIFWARLLTSRPLTAQDDASSVTFRPIRECAELDLFSKVSRDAIQLLLSRELHRS